MKLPISQEKEPIGRICEHCALFLGTGNRLSNGRENPFSGGCALSLLVQRPLSPHALYLDSNKKNA